MNSFVCFTLILLKCSFLWAATTVPRIPEGRIIGGHNAKPHAHPYLVSLQTRFLFIRVHICGGALLNEYWILSAAHCLSESFLIKWLPMDAIAGSNDVNYFEPTAQIATISRRVPHPKYLGDIGPYDISMLKVIMPFTFTNEVKPIHLPENSQLRHKDLTVTSWGALRTTILIPDLPTRLQEVRVTYVPYKECYKAIYGLLEDDEFNALEENAHICTGPLSGGVAACSGDSGGPLIEYMSYYEQDRTTKENHNDTTKYNSVLYKGEGSNADNKIPVVLGVVSWGISPCGERGAPTVYTNVSNYMDFIYNYIYE